MLGEGARTVADADRYEAVYADAITAVGKHGARARGPSAATASRSSCRPCRRAMRRRTRPRVWAELYPRVLRLALIAAEVRHQLHHGRRGGRPAGPVAEAAGPAGARAGSGRLDGAWGWRCRPIRSAGREVIARVAELARSSGRRLMVRLVKGAYWDTEIKRAQVAGPDRLSGLHHQGRDRPVNYLVCARACWAPRRTSTASSPPTTPTPWPPCA